MLVLLEIIQKNNGAVRIVITKIDTTQINTDDESGSIDAKKMNTDYECFSIDVKR